MIHRQDPSARIRLRLVKLIGVRLHVEQILHRLVNELLLDVGVACRDQFLETVPIEVEREEQREVGPLGVVAWTQDRLASEHIGIVFDISVELALNVVELSVELIVLVMLRLRQPAVLPLRHVNHSPSQPTDFVERPRPIDRAT